MPVSTLGQNSSARRSLDQALLDQIGLVDALDRVGLLVDRVRQGREPDGAAGELLRNGLQDDSIVAVQACLVDIQQAQSLRRDLGADRSGSLDLREVADAAQDAICDPRSPSRARGDGLGTAVVDLDSEDPGGPVDNRRQVGLLVVLETVRNTEPVVELLGQEARAGGGADEGERRQVERYRPSARPLA